MAFTYRETQIVKGMLARGDKQHDIAAYFGVNGGRIGEVSSGNCDYPEAPALPESELPPSGPFPSPYDIIRARETLRGLAKAIGAADEGKVRETAIKGIFSVIDIIS